MNQQTIDKIQPYIDEYCKAKNAYYISIKNTVGSYSDYPKPATTLIHCEAIMDACEKSIMQILIEENQLPTNPLI